ncbi:hypothetical protein MRBLBA71_001897 [Bacillus nitratireducens]|uniref:hypothetical protein n=1 Tax=Bacillus nitratireducens TaxID=2026193 RepID=UPI003466E74A
MKGVILAGETGSRLYSLIKITNKHTITSRDVSLGSYVEHFFEQSNGAKILVKDVPNPQRYDVPEFKNDRIISIEKKPNIPKSTATPFHNACLGWSGNGHMSNEEG